MRRYEFTVPGVMPKKRPRHVPRRGLKFPLLIHGYKHLIGLWHTYMEKDYKLYKKVVAQCAMSTGVNVLDYCKVDCVFNIPLNKNGTIPLRKADRDNAYGAILDGLEGVAYTNDGNTFDGTIKYFFIPNGQSPFVSVIITEVDPLDYCCEGVKL